MRLADKIATMARRGAPAPAYGGLCFTAMSADSSVQLTAVGSAPAVTLVKSFDGVSWSDYLVGDTIELNSVGDCVYFAAGEGGNTRFGSSTTKYNHFVFGGKIAASGNITSLLDYNFTDSLLSATYTFYSLFYSCENLLTAPDLPSTTLAIYCYRNMFSGCTGLTSAPELPATTLAIYCYNSMFSGCTGLTSAPELPATTLANYCYNSMFSGCVSLSVIRVLFKSWGSYTPGWLDGVAAVGTFYKPSKLRAEYGTGSIPTGWYVVNID